MASANEVSQKYLENEEGLPSIIPAERQIFWTYPSWESEKGVVNQPMLFMPESKNLILDYENGRGKEKILVRTPTPLT